MEASKEAFNIRYDVVGRVDGVWTIQAFSNSDKPLGCRIEVQTPAEAWKIFMLLNGYATELPFDPDDKTADIDLEGVA